jgi:transposase InsO family protein
VEIHGNAGLLPRQRALMCRRVREEGWTVAEAAEAAGVAERTTYRWLRRWDSSEAMTDRSSAPKRRPTKTSAEREALVEQLRRLRWTAPRIAAELKMPTSTVCAVLRRLGLHRLWRLEPPEPPNRYCRRHPGELIHVDVKKLGRFDRPGHRVTGKHPGYHHTQKLGWEYCHVAIDDTTRVAYVEVLGDEKGATCVGFLRRAIQAFASMGVTVERVMTDNGTGYRSKVHRAAVVEMGVRHLRTQPYRPRTNGKAERFIQTLQREWAYGAAYTDSAQRRQALEPWLRYYNGHRPHSALGHKTPLSQLG